MARTNAHSCFSPKQYARGGQVKSAKTAKVMREYSAGELHSGSRSGPVVTDKKQAMAIALNSARGGKK